MSEVRGRSRRWGVFAAVALCALLAASELTLPAASEAASGMARVSRHNWRVNGHVNASLIVKDTVYVAGHFSRAIGPGGSSLVRRNVAAFSMSTGKPLRDWKARPHGTIKALAVRGNWLYLSGHFQKVGPNWQPRLARVSLETGYLDHGFTPDIDAPGRALAVDGSHLFVGGFFRHIGGRKARSVAKIDAITGARIGHFSTTANKGVYSLAVDRKHGRLYLGGLFTRVNKAHRRGLAAVSTATGKTLRIHYRGSVTPVYDVALGAGRVFAAQGGRSNELTAWRASTGRRDWSLRARGDMQAVAYRANTVYFGFHQGFGHNPRLKALAARASTGRIQPWFKPRIPAYWGVDTISVNRRGVVLGGAFDKVDGMRAGHWVRLIRR